MALIAPPTDRARVEETATGFDIAIPTRKNWFVILFLAAWLFGWYWGEVSAARVLMSAEPGGPTGRGFLFFWLAGWTVGGTFALLTLLWTLVGIERIRIDGGQIATRREILGIGLSREYDANQVQNLRVAANRFGPFHPRAGFRSWGSGGGRIAFDYGSATVRIGSALEEAEATRIVARIGERFARFRRQDG